MEEGVKSVGKVPLTTRPFITEHLQPIRANVVVAPDQSTRTPTQIGGWCPTTQQADDDSQTEKGEGVKDAILISAVVGFLIVALFVFLTWLDNLDDKPYPKSHKTIDEVIKHRPKCCASCQHWINITDKTFNGECRAWAPTGGCGFSTTKASDYCNNDWEAKT